MRTRYAWSELELMCERGHLSVEKAIEQWIQWGEHTHKVAVLSQHRVEIQAREIQTLMEANIRWGIRVEALEKEVAQMAAQIITLEEAIRSDMEVQVDK